MTWYDGTDTTSAYPGRRTDRQLFARGNGRQHATPYIPIKIGGLSNLFPITATLFARQQQLGLRAFDMAPTVAPNIDENRSYLVSNVSTYDLGGGVNVKNIIGYWNTHSFVWINRPSYNFSQINVSQDRHLHQFSEELQLTGTSFGGALKWIAGGYLANYNSTVFQLSRLFNASNAVSSTISSNDRYESRALFAQVTLDFGNLGLAGLKLTGGIRQSWDKRFGSQLPLFPNEIATSNSPLSWTVGLDYQATRNILIYGVTRRSYKAGGFNLVSGNLPASLFVFAPESLQDVELGIKSQFNAAGMPIRANLALYRGNYKDIQTTVTYRCGGTTTGSLITNAAKGTPKGLEFEIEARPFRNFRLSGFYNLTLGRYGEFSLPDVSSAGCILSATGNLTGQNFGNIAKHTAGLTAEYTVPLGGRNEELEFTGNLYTRSHRLGNDLLGVYTPMPGYTLLNFRIDYNNIGGSNFSAGVYVRNLTNKLYEITRQDSINTGGSVIVQYGDPRTFGVTARVKF